MRFFVSALLLAAATAAFPQIQGKASLPQGKSSSVTNRSSQLMRWKGSACPITFTEAGFSSPNRDIFPVGQRTPESGSLNLRFHNNSGTDIRSASITASMRVKTNLYDLDARPIEFHLSFSSMEDLDAAMTQLAHIPLPQHVYPYGVSRVKLDQVIFADGTFWTASEHSGCVLNQSRSIEQITPAPDLK
jgi:hypothetical protein